MLRRFADCRDAGMSRRECLVELAKLDSLYVPSLYATAIDSESGFEVVTDPLVAGIPLRPKRAIVEDLNRFPFPDDSPIAAAEAIFDRLSVEIARGCTEGCRFCQAGMIYRPVRERDPQQVVETVLSALEKTGYDEAGLTTLSTADYSCISPLMSQLMRELKQRNVSLSVASLRAYGVDENSLDEMASYRAQGLTFAPEAGTQRMRDVVNKNVTEEDLARTAERVFSRGWNRMKLYFMIGLPGEMDEDVAGIMETGRRMKDIGFRHVGRKVGITCAVSSHVPKPHTPFQWVAMDSIEEIERKQDLLQRLARTYRLEFRRHDPRTSFLEGVLGRGDRRVGAAIELAFRAGARFDGWDEQLRWPQWLAALQESVVDPQLYLGTLRTDVRLPWDHLDMQLDAKFLLRDYKRALRDKLSPPCGKPVGNQVHHSNLQDHDADERLLVCYNCGVACDMQRMREERGEYLAKLGAFTPITDSPARREVAAKQDRIRRGQAPNLRPGDGEPIRVRLAHTKLGADAMSGHLDLTRKITRTLRRAGLPLWYTEGYHPKVSISFGPALPLGVESDLEYCEVKLTEPVESGELLRRLNEVSEPGIRWLAAEPLAPGAPSLARVLKEVEWQVDCALFDGAALAAAIEAFHARARWPLQVRRKRDLHTLELKECVLALALKDSVLHLRTDVGAPVHLRPAELLSALLCCEVELSPLQMRRRARLVQGFSAPAAAVDSSELTTSVGASNPL
jgi:radical SAM-linked protein